MAKPRIWRIIRCQQTTSQPRITAKIQMKMVRHASMVAREDPLSFLVTMIPKKLKNAMETTLSSVVTCSCREAPIWATASWKFSTGSPLRLILSAMGRAMAQMPSPQNPSSPTATFAGILYFESTFSSTMNWVAAATWARNTRMSPNRTILLLSAAAFSASPATQSSLWASPPAHLSTLARPTRNAPKTMLTMPTQWCAWSRRFMMRMVRIPVNITIVPRSIWYADA